MNRMLRTVYAFVMAGAVSAPAAAQVISDVKLFADEEIRIKAPAKVEQPISKVPNSVTVITAQQIRESGARSIPELLRLVAGVNVRWNPMVQTIDIRGFGQNPFTSRVLLMIDGVPYNAWDKGGFPQHPSFDFFVLQNVKRIEIVRGPGSALYGENAFWGVLNIVTLSGEDLQGGRVEVFGGARETGSAGAYYGKRFTAGSLFVSGKFTHSQLPMAFWAEENDSAVKGFDGFVKASYKDWQFSYYRHDDAFDGFEEPIPDPSLPPGSAFRSAETLKQHVDILATKYDHTFNPKVSFGGDVSFARRNGSHCAACHGVKENPHFAESANHGYQLIGDFRLAMRPVPSHSVLVGFEARKVDDGDHHEEMGLPPGSTAPFVTSYTKPAFYAQDQVSLANDRVQLVGGFRYDGSTDVFDGKFSPRIAAVYSPTNQVVLRGGWSSAFRFPNFSELYQNTWFINVDAGFAIIPLAAFGPNPNLEAEEIQTFELGGEYRFSANLSAKADFYRSRVKNFVTPTLALVPPPALPQIRFENHPDEASVTGIEMEMRFSSPRGVTGFANYAIQSNDAKNGLVDSTGAPMQFPYAPEHKFNVGTYFGPFKRVRGAFELQWKGEYVGPQMWYLINSGFTDPTVRPLDGYALANARVSYDLPFASGPSQTPTKLVLYVKNIFDERPTETLIGVDSRIVGREVFGGLTFGF